MVVSRVHPIHDVILQGTAPNVSTGSFALVRAPFAGRIFQIGAVTGSQVNGTTATTATDVAVVTTQINGIAITNGAANISVATATAGGFHVFNVPTGPGTTNNVVEGDIVRWAFTGAGAAGGNVYCYAVMRRTAI